MKVYGKKPITVCAQHVNATHRGTQVFQRRKPLLVCLLLDLLTIAIIDRAGGGHCRKYQIRIAGRRLAGGLRNLCVPAGSVVNVRRRDVRPLIVGLLVHREQAPIRVISPGEVAIVCVVGLRLDDVVFAPIRAGATNKIVGGSAALTGPLVVLSIRIIPFVNITAGDAQVFSARNSKPTH
jgi:hypothetical protein